MGRRVRKRVETYNGSSWPETSDELFVYDGWNVVMVLNGNKDTVRKYTWGLALDTTRPAPRAGLPDNPQASPAAASQGLDLSGTLHGAGGIGGLLAAVETQSTSSELDDERYWFLYDANGNVGQVLDATDTGNITIAARYEYDPYGNPIPIPQPPGPGPYADANPIRFSTKWFDAETGLGYWGYRYYSPRLGRWISRDPIEEWGGLNLYAYVDNNSVLKVDYLGFRDWFDNLAEYVAGIGDALSMGLTRQARKGLNWLVNDGYSDSWIRPDSGYYIAGEVTEVSVEIIVSFGGAGLRHVAARTSRAAIEGGARQGFKRTHRLSGGFVHHANPIKGHPGGPLARYPLPFEWAARGHWNMKWVPTKSAHLAEHDWMIALEALDRVRESTILVRQAGNAVFQHAAGTGCDDVWVSVGASVYGEVQIGSALWTPPPLPWEPPSSIEAYSQWVEAGNVWIVP